MSNPIKYSDLIEKDQSFDDLLAALKGINETYGSLLKKAKTEKNTLKEALSFADPSTAEGQSAIATLSKQIDELVAKVKSLENAQKSNAQAQRTINQATQESIRLKLEQKEAAKQLTNEVKAQMAAEQLDAKEMERISKEANVQAMSYNELAKVYATLKAQVNGMTAATKEEAAAREKTAAVARRVYEQMNTLQQSTGKYTLQVGNYAKSWNGLNIAMQQIVREVPNMAMGFNTFFLAISNNIPILSDQIKLAQDKYKADKANIEVMKQQGAGLKEIEEAESKLVPVGKQLLTSLLSWQTIMMAGVTVLTMYGSKLIDLIFNRQRDTRETLAQKRVQDQYNESLKNAKTFAELYADALKRINTAENEEVTNLRVIYGISQDATRSMDDRRIAAETLQQMYPDYLGNMSTEEIMAGNIKNAYDELTKSLLDNAKARAAMNAITDLYGQQYSTQANYDTAKANYDQKKAVYDSWAAQARNGDQGAAQQVHLAEGDMQKAYSEMMRFDMALQDIDNSIDKLKKDIPADGLPSLLSNGKNGSKDQNIEDNFWEWMQRVIDGMDEGLAKSLRQTEMNYAQALAGYDKTERELRELMKTGTAEEKAEAKTQLEILAQTIDQTMANLTRDKRSLVEQMLLGYTKDGVADEGDLDGIEEKAKATARKVTEALLQGELEVNNKAAYESFFGGSIDKAQLEEQLKENSQLYWKTLLEQFEQQGIMTEEEFNKIAEHLVPEDEKEGSFLQKLLGMDDKTWRSTSNFLRKLNRVVNMTVDYINDVIDAYKEEAEAAAEAAEAQVDAAQTVYEAELTAYENGYANNVEYARKELDLKKQQYAEAQKEVEKYEKLQEEINTISQVSNLVTASAELFKACSGMGVVGVAVAAAATAAMFTAFAAAKIKAKQVAKKTTYGEGGYEYLDYGGTHASGHDIDFGTTKDGSPRRVERGEMVAVFNAKNTRKYGTSMLGDIVDAINDGTFQETFGNAFSGASQYNVNVVAADSPYTKGMAGDLSTIRRQIGRQSQTIAMGDGSVVEKYRNRTRRIKHVS